MKGKFPNNLRLYMEREGIGPTALSRKVGTSKQQISRWAAGERKITVEWAAKLARELNADPEDVLFPRGVIRERDDPIRQTVEKMKTMPIADQWRIARMVHSYEEAPDRA